MDERKISNHLYFTNLVKYKDVVYQFPESTCYIYLDNFDIVKKRGDDG